MNQIKRFFYWFTTILLVMSGSVSAAPSFKIKIDTPSGLPEISYSGTPIVKSYYAYWGNNWAWQSANSSFSELSNHKYESIHDYKDMGLKIKTSTQKISDKQLDISLDIDAQKDHNPFIGGGIVFKLNTELLREKLGEPSISPNMDGWDWGSGENRISFRFDKPVLKVFFEPGGKSEIRAFFHSKAISKGQIKNSAWLHINGKSEFVGTNDEYYRTFDMSTWKESSLAVNTIPIDLSFLNQNEKPAGKRGYLKAKGQDLIFEDGTKVKFWGTNVNAYSLFSSSKITIKSHAKRISALGFNLVRIHHYDSPWVSPNIFGDSKKNSTRQLSAESLDKLDWWIHCLKEEGIYVWLDLHVERPLKLGDEALWFDEIRKGKDTAQLKGYNYVNPSIEKLMMEFNTQLLNHINNYTKVAYKDDPAIATILITNENDVTHHFGHALLPDKKVENHSKAYMSKANAFADKWSLSKDKTWRSWEPGPSKLFLNQLEHEFNDRMIRHLKSIGVKVPIVTTSFWGDSALHSLPALTDGAMIDVHAYQGLGAIDSDPENVSNFTHWISAGQLTDKPVSVSEWGWGEAFTQDRHTMSLLAASYAGSQGWDSMMQFAYAQSPLGLSQLDGGMAHQWDSYNDPSAISTLPAAALMFRQNHIPEHINQYVFKLSPADLTNKAWTPKNSVLLRRLSEIGKVSMSLPDIKELTWLRSSGSIPNATVVTLDNNSVITKNSASKANIVRDSDSGVLTINSEKTQAVTGWIGGKEINLDHVKITAINKTATVSIQSMDNQKISESGNLLISIGRNSTRNSKKLYIVEPFQGSILIKARKNLKLFNANQEEIPVGYQDGYYKIELNKDTKNYWFNLKG